MTSSQQFIPIKEIRDDLIFLTDGGVSMVIITSAVNFGLLFETEQISIIESFAGFLNSLSFPIQIVILSHRLDVSSYLKTLDKAMNSQTNPKLKELTAHYHKFIESIIKENDVLDKKFYICINASAPELGLLSKNIVDTSKKATTILSPRRDHIVRQLGRLGLKARQMTNVELIKLFYVVYNGLEDTLEPEPAKIPAIQLKPLQPPPQPIAQPVVSPASPASTRGEPSVSLGGPDDNFAKAMGALSLIDLKTKIKTDLENEAKYNNELDYEEAILQEIEKITTVELPDILVNDELNRMLVSLQRRVADMGLLLEDYLKGQNKTLDGLKAEWKVQAEKNVRMELGLSEVARLEKVDISDTEVQAEVDKIQDAKMKAQFEAQEPRLHLKHSLRQIKTLDLLKALVKTA